MDLTAQMDEVMWSLQHAETQAKQAAQGRTSATALIWAHLRLPR